VIGQPGRDLGWFDDPGWAESFKLEVGYVSGLARPGVAEGWVGYRPNTDYIENTMAWGSNPSYGADVYIVEVSPPDEHGFCSFGASVWDKPMSVRTAKTVLAEVNPQLIRTYGENYVHVSQIDHFVWNEAPTGWTISRTPKHEAPKPAAPIAEHIGKLVQNGDTIQIGAGGITEWFPRLGVFDNHVDLGLFTELTPRGTTILVAGGVITNRYKTLHPGKCVSTAAGGSRDDVAFINENPLFELYNSEYVINPLTVAQHRNMITINQGLAVDFTGQSTAETIGSLQFSGPGGQPAMVMGALLADGGRSVMVIPSVTNDGQQSRIVPQLPAGAAVTVPRYMADIVVSEFGVALLRWKTMKERARELIRIAHPDFQRDLEKAFHKQFGAG
jgi:4-hydroxybutyrate CoA-transferase